MIRTNLAAAIGLSCLLAFGTCACSSGSKGEEETEESVASEEEAVEEAAPSAAASISDLSGWNSAWTGKSSTGYEIYYAESPTGYQGFLVLHNADTDDTQYYVGDTALPQQGYVTVNGTGHSCTFEMLDAAEDLSTIKLNFGDEFGEAELTQCTMGAFTAGVRAIDPDGEILA